MTIEEMLIELGDNFRELTRYYSLQKWTAIGVPRELKGLSRVKKFGQLRESKSFNQIEDHPAYFCGMFGNN